MAKHYLCKAINVKELHCFCGGRQRAGPDRATAPSLRGFLLTATGRSSWIAVQDA
jgi:hypothetical protein